MLAEFERTAPIQGLRFATERLLRPAIGFSRPGEVLRDPFLDTDGKRAVLSSWASDASAVENWPTLRWLFGTEAPVPLAEVLEALNRLDREAPDEDAPHSTGDRPRPAQRLRHHDARRSVAKERPRRFSGQFNRSSQLGDHDHEAYA